MVSREVVVPPMGAHGQARFGVPLDEGIWQAPRPASEPPRIPPNRRMKFKKMEISGNFRRIENSRNFPKYAGNFLIHGNFQYRLRRGTSTHAHPPDHILEL